MVLVFLTWILIWQKCSQHSGMAAVSKWQALAIHFSLQMCYIFWTSECRVASDLGLCTTAGLIKRILLRTCEIRRILRPKMYWNQKSPLRIGILFTIPEVVHRLRSHSHLYLDIQNTLQIRTGKSKDSASGPKFSVSLLSTCKQYLQKPPCSNMHCLPTVFQRWTTWTSATKHTV